MAICLAQSLLHRDGFDATDQMNRYLNWWRWGYPSPTGECFDIGMTVQDALRRFTATGEPIAGATSPPCSRKWLTDATRAGYPDLSDVLQYARLSSKTTHGAAEAVECCSVLAEIIANALSGMDSNSNVLSATQDGLTSSAVISIAQADYVSKSINASFGPKLAGL